MATLNDVARGDKPAAGDPGTPGPVRRWHEAPTLLCPLCERPTHISSAGGRQCLVRCFGCSPAGPSDGRVEFVSYGEQLATAGEGVQ